MARTVTVTFEDGTQHVYENVPDSATPDSVTQRVAQDFGRPVVNIDGGRTPEKTTLQKIIGPTLEGNWEKDSLIAPVIQGIAGRVLPSMGLMDGAEAKQMVQQSDANLVEKGKNFVQGVKTVAEDPIAAAKRLYTAITERPAETAGQIVKGIVYDPELLLLGPGAMGRSAQMLESAGTGISKAAPVIGSVAAMPYTVPRDIAKGAFVNQPKTASSAMVPLAETFYPSQAGKDFMAGRMTLPELEAKAKPTASLRADPAFRIAEKLANKDVTGQSLVPLPGRGAEAFGERLMAGYQRNPALAVADIALPFIGVPPIQPIFRAGQIAADKYLASKTQFQPGFIEQLGAARAAQIGAPRPAGAPVTGPVAPPPIPQQNQMMLPLSNQIARAPEQFDLQTTPGFVPPQPQAQNLQQAVQQAAAARVQGMPPVAAPVAPNPQGQAIIDQIRARAQQPKPLDFDQMAKAREADLALQARKAMGESYQPPKSTAERLQDLKLSAATQQPVEPVVPTYTPKEEAMFQSQVKTAPRGYGRGETVTEIEVMSAERKARESGLRSDELVAKALRQRLDQQTAQGIAPTPKAPPGVIGFITPKENTYHEISKKDSQQAGGVTRQKSRQVRDNGVEVNIQDNIDSKGQKTATTITEINPNTKERLTSMTLGNEIEPLYVKATDAAGVEYGKDISGPFGKNYDITTVDGKSVYLDVQGRLAGNESLMQSMKIFSKDDLVKMVESKQQDIIEKMQK